MSHVITRLYSEEFDFPPFEDGARKEFMVATIPRTGSTNFCIECWRTGVLGAPMEYPNLSIMDPLMERVRHAIDMEAYWNAVKRLRTSPNGVFGYKMFPSNYVEIRKQHPKLLKHLAPDSVIFLTREDDLAQAISYSKAIRSKVWFSGISDRLALPFDRDHVSHCLELIRRQVDFWKRVFDLTRTDVLHVTYEQYLDAPEPTLDKVRQFVTGAAPSNCAPLRIPGISIQRDGLSRAWKSQYLGNETSSSGNPA